MLCMADPVTNSPTARRGSAAAGAGGGLTGGIFIGLCLVVVLAPLPLGSGRPLAWDALALGVALLLLLTLGLPTAEAAVSRERLAPAVILFAAVIGVALLQSVAWLPAALRNPIWDQAADALASPLRGSVSVDRFVSLIYVLRLLSYAGIFYLAVIAGRDPQRARIGVSIVALSGFLYAIYGLFDYWSGSRTVLWYSKTAYLEDVTGPFINHNSFATYLGLSTLAALVLAMNSLSRIELHDDLYRRVSGAVNFLTKRIPLLLVVFVLLTALLLTHSRGGLSAAVFGNVVLIIAIAVAPGAGRLRRVTKWSIIPCMLLIVGAIVISGGATMNRFLGGDIESNTRLVVDQLTLQAISDYPLVGIGLGSFASVFPVYQLAPLGAYFDLAHNDYLQNALELGIPAAAALLAALGWLVWSCVNGIRNRQRDVIYPCLGLAVTALVALHATVDFSLQIPAVTVTYLFLLGIAVAQSVSSRNRV